MQRTWLRLTCVLAVSAVLFGCQSRTSSVPSVSPAPAAPAAEAPPEPARTAPLAKAVPVVATMRLFVRPNGERSSVPFAPGDTLPYRSPLRIEFNSTAGAMPEAQREGLRQALEALGAVVRLSGAGVSATFASPPRHLTLPASLFPGGQPYTLQVAPPPHLVLVNRSTGVERSIAEVPTDIDDAALFGNGKWAVLGTQDGDGRLWLINTTSGSKQLLPFAYHPDGNVRSWFQDTLIFAQGGKVHRWHPDRGEVSVVETTPLWWDAASPDGHYLAGITWGTPSADGRIATITVYVYDLETRQERKFPNVTTARIGNSGPYASITWAPDGQSLLIGAAQDQKQSRWTRLDMSTGQTTPAVEPKAAPAAVPGPKGWHLVAGSWGAIEVITPEGKRVQLGEGLPLGWAPSGEVAVIRWHGYQYREPVSMP